MELRPKEPSYSIGNEEREKKIIKRRKFEVPGPGKYNIFDPNFAPKFSFPKDIRRSSKKLIILPGPGAYKIPTSFDYISELSRNKGAFDPTFKYV